MSKWKRYLTLKHMIERYIVQKGSNRKNNNWSSLFKQIRYKNLLLTYEYKFIVMVPSVFFCVHTRLQIWTYKENHGNIIISILYIIKSDNGKTSKIIMKISSNNNFFTSYNKNKTVKTWQIKYQGKFSENLVSSPF